MKHVRHKKTRFTVAAMVTILAGLIGGALIGWRYAPLIGWDIGALTLLAMILHDFTGHSVEHTAEIAQRDDMNHSVFDVILITASVVSIAAVAYILTSNASHSSHERVLNVGFGLVSVIISWAIVHSIFALRYASLYYRGDPGGVDFNQNRQPRFDDFAYMAFTIGMTYQVSDTNLNNPEFRSTALRHAIISFVLGTAIIATTINFIASLVR